MTRIIPNLWISDGRLQEAVDFYCGLFDDAEITSVGASYDESAGKYAGTPMLLNFRIGEMALCAISGGDTRFEPNESFSLAIPCEDQAEIDRLWAALSEGGIPGQCGWLKDRFGYSWQIYPSELDAMMTDPDPETAKRLEACMLAVDGRAMQIAEFRAAYDG